MTSNHSHTHSFTQHHIEQRVQGWYPTERTVHDKQLYYQSLWMATQSGVYPGDITDNNQTASMHGQLWFEKAKFVRIFGEPQIVSICVIRVVCA